MKRVTAVFAAIALFTAVTTPPAHAIVPVTDAGAIAQLVKQVQDGLQELQTMKQQLQMFTSVPQILVGQVRGLMDQAIANPLQGIMGDLNGLMSGTGTGNCTGSQNLLGVNQFVHAIPLPVPGVAQAGAGMDFAGALINGQAARTAGVLACNQQAMNGVQQQLDMMPQLLDQLQACPDITCATAVTGRIQYQVAQGQALQTQSLLMGQQFQIQQQIREENNAQFIRGGEQQMIQDTGGAGAIGGGGGTPAGLSVAAPSALAPTFGAGG
jgi:hypothetical protein